MTIEINEIAIRMHITDSDELSDVNSSDEQSTDAQMVKEQIVQECVRRVLRALEAAGER